jgi:hypothetical protein
MSDQPGWENSGTAQTSTAWRPCLPGRNQVPGTLCESNQCPGGDAPAGAGRGRHQGAARGALSFGANPQPAPRLVGHPVRPNLDTGGLGRECQGTAPSARDRHPVASWLCKARDLDNRGSLR